MEIKQVKLQPLGMNQDVSVSNFNPSLSFNNRNIRITTRDSNTLMSIENERGNTQISLKTPEGITELLGTCIGYAVLNNYIVIFTTQNTGQNSIDRIYRINENYETLLLFEGNLSFDTDHLIECIPFYETELIQKVYWTDGKNQLRVINITAEEEVRANWVNTSFNFSQELQLNEVVTIKKNNTGGQFASGVIQYAFTYYNLSGPETNIFYSSDLYYLSAVDRGLNGEELSNNSFTINIQNLDTNFQYLRVYSIHRSSLNATPTVKIVSDYQITSSSLELTDTGYYGSDVDSTKLLFVGGEEIVAGTITSKDNTLFAGNLQIAKDAAQNETILENISDQQFNWEYREPLAIEQKSKAFNGLYTYLPQSLFTKATDYRHFKSGQLYRLGIQLQSSNGKWSSPIYLGGNNYSQSFDKLCDKPFLTEVAQDKVNLYLNKGVLTLDSTFTQLLAQEGYKKVRPIIVMPELSDRSVIAQGLVTNTIAYDRRRQDNNAFSYTDHIARPYKFNQNLLTAEIQNISNPNAAVPENYGPTYINVGHFLSPAGGYEYSDDYQAFGIVNEDSNKYKFPFKFFYNPTSTSFTINEPESPEITVGDNPVILDNTNLPFIDENMVSFWSPEFQYNETLNSYLDNTYFYLTGLAQLAASSSSTKAIMPSGNIRGESLGYINRGTYDGDDWSKGALFKTGLASTGLVINNEGETEYALLATFSPESYVFDSVEQPKSYDLKSKSIGWLEYALSNVVFDVTKEQASMPIYKPLQILKTESLVPYNSNIADNNGTITYNSAPDEIFLSYTGGSFLQGRRHIRVNPKPAVVKFKSNSHGIFSFGETTVDNKTYSYTLPKITTQDTETLISKESAIETFPYTLTLTADAPVYSTDQKQVEFKVYWTITDGVDGATLDQITTSTFIFIDLDLKVYNNPSTQDDQYMGTIENGLLWQIGPNNFSGTVTFTLNLAHFPQYIDGFLRTAWDPVATDTGLDWTKIGSSTSSDTSNPIDQFSMTYGEAVLSENNVHQLKLITKNYSPGGGGGTGSIAGLYPAPFWRQDSGIGYIKKVININDIILQNPHNTFNESARFFYLGEIRKNVINPYGGYGQDALNNNTWIPAGEPVKIVPNQSITVEYTSGDTFVGRYDCLRTYSDTTFVQKVYNVVSFLCESYINLDGRYDRNRYNIDVRDKNVDNYGLINEVYSQKNNYFTFNTLNLEQFKATSFPTQVTWSLVKSNGETIDSWTNLNLTSVLDLEGSLGTLNSLKTFNSSILAFQDKAIAEVLFNSRVQIPTSDDIPIEISNNYKVSGYRYITNQLGAINKWSINQTKQGIYFIDDLNKTINNFSNEGIKDLSIEKGFKSWSNNNIKNSGILKIKNFKDLSNFSTVVDKVHNDVYFINNAQCLGYSETLGKFTSFYSYENIPFMFNYQNEFISVYNDGNYTKLFLQNKGVYNEFFGTLVPSEIDYIISPEPTIDKVFNNIEFRADCFKELLDPNYRITEDSNFRVTNDGSYRILQNGEFLNYQYVPFRTLDKVEYFNEFQYGVFDWKTPNKSELKKKFRVWRSALPRQKGSLDRIRNPWTHLKLYYRPEELEDYRLLLHDIVVKYTTI